MRTGECDRRIFGPIAVALRNGPHEAASVREVSRALSKLILGRDATGETSSALALARWALQRRCCGALRLSDGQAATHRFELTMHAHAMRLADPMPNLRRRFEAREAKSPHFVSS